MEVTKPYKFIGFGAMEVTKPYKVIGFGVFGLAPSFSVAPPVQVVAGIKAIHPYM